jgi:hypothetical protein
MAPDGETVEELKEDYELMAEAFKLPVLSHATGREIKVHPAGQKGKQK